MGKIPRASKHKECKGRRSFRILDHGVKDAEKETAQWLKTFLAAIIEGRNDRVRTRMITHHHTGCRPAYLTRDYSV